MNKRTYATMEFLLTYGWAIIVVLVAIGALAYFGILSPDKFRPDLCWCSNKNMTEMTRMKYDDMIYIECAKINKYLNDDKTRIESQITYSIFYCSENKTLIPII